MRRTTSIVSACRDVSLDIQQRGEVAELHIIKLLAENACESGFAAFIMQKWLKP